MPRHTAASPSSPSRPGARWLLAAGSVAAAALLAVLSLQALPAAAGPSALAVNGTCPPNEPNGGDGCCPPYYQSNCCPGGAYPAAPPNHCCGTKFNPSGNPADCCDAANPVFDLLACLCYLQPPLKPVCDAVPPVSQAPAAAAAVAHKPMAAPPPAALA